MTVRKGLSQVGIYWYLKVPGKFSEMLVDCVPVTDAEAYGEFLTHGAHYEYWTKLAALGAREIRALGISEAVVWSDYDDWPRGRVVFHKPTSRFILYADPKLQTAQIISALLHRFSLPADRTDIRSDAHYVSKGG